MQRCRRQATVAPGPFSLLPSNGQQAVTPVTHLSSNNVSPAPLPLAAVHHNAMQQRPATDHQTGHQQAVLPYPSASGPSSPPRSNGQEAVTPVTRLSSSKNNFERNTVDHFDLTLPNVGVMKRIRIGHDNSGLGADWHLNMVRMCI